MADIDLDAIEAAAVAAGGPEEEWVFDPWADGDGGSVSRAGGTLVLETDEQGYPSRAEAAHIAMMDPATTLQLVEEIRRLRAALKEAHHE